MITVKNVIRIVHGMKSSELYYWIEEGWVRPTIKDGKHDFCEIDIARVRLIQQLRRDLAIDERALPVVLNLLDQLYEARRRLRAVNAAIAAQPADIRKVIFGRMRDTKTTRAARRRTATS